jgi:phytoene dehydrogenase-like protein
MATRLKHQQHDLSEATSLQPVRKPARSTVAILGGGPAGLGAAWQLARRGKANVVLFEQRDAVGGNAGSLNSMDFQWTTAAIGCTQPVILKFSTT